MVDNLSAYKSSVIFQFCNNKNVNKQRFGNVEYFKSCTFLFKTQPRLEKVCKSTRRGVKDETLWTQSYVCR